MNFVIMKCQCSFLPVLAISMSILENQCNGAVFLDTSDLIMLKHELQSRAEMK